MPACRERSSSVNYGGPALVTNGDYLTIRANPLEKNLMLWKFEEGKRSSVTWIRNIPTATRQWHDLKVRIATSAANSFSLPQSLLRKYPRSR
jgi:hypothetical protein